MNEVRKVTPDRPISNGVRVDLVRGTTVLRYLRTPESMIATLNIVPETRVFYGSLRGQNGTRMFVNFTDEFGSVNSFESPPLDTPAANALSSVFTEAIEKSGHPSVGGMIRIHEETGEIYRIYDDPGSRERQHQAWSEDVTEAFSQSGGNGYFQHLTDYENEITTIGYFDESRGIHMVTRFDEQDSYHMDELKRRIYEETGINPTLRPTPPDEVWQEMVQLDNL